MPTFRERSFQKSSIHGFVRDSSGVLLATGNFTDEGKTCYDYWKKEPRKTPILLKGMMPATNFQVDNWIQTPFYGTRRSGSIRLDRYPSQAFIPKGNIGNLYPGVSTRASENYWYVLKLLERTNPYRTEFSVPVFIKELAEIALMFRLAARTFSGFVGGSYLNYRFGWVAFVNDLKTLANITKALERRVREFQSLQKHGGLRRQVELDRRSASQTNKNVAMNSTWAWSLRADQHTNADLRVYGSVRWVPTRNFQEDLRQLGVINLAFRKVFDLETIDAQTVWELIPWSWLVDYFTSIGSYLRANNGAVSVEPYDICIMRHYVARTHCYPIPNPGSPTEVTGSAYAEYRIKGRDVWTGNVGFPRIHWELLSASQWKVILALFLRFAGK